MGKGKIVKLKWGKKYGDKDYSPKISFKDVHKDYGRAEFEIRPIFKYGKLKEFLIYPKQQETNVFYYVIEAQNQREFQISSWTHKGFANPNIWLEFWCKEHKTICHRVYVPKDTNIITFENLRTFNIRFDKEVKE